MSDGLHLLPRHRAMIEELLREHLPDVEVWAYGSRVTGESHDGSDLDLVLRGPNCEEIDIGRLGDFTEGVELSTIPFIVEARDWARLPESFRESILQDYTVLVGTDSFRTQIEASCVVLQERDPHSRWPHVPLGELVTNFDSRRVPLSRRERSARPGNFRYYGATGILDYIDDYIFEGLHLLVAEDGSVETPNGNPFLQLVDGQFWVNNHAHIIRGSSDNETRYLYYALSSVQVRPFVSGSVQEKLSQANLNRIPVPYPSQESERSEIINILGALDDKIELNRRMSETLEEMATALFKSWFVDFDPVRAKSKGRLTGLPNDLDALFPDSFEPSELGDIPTGWQVTSLGELVVLAYGKALRAQDRRYGKVPVYGSNGQVGWHDKHLVTGPGIVVGRKGNPGVVTWSPSDFFPIDTTFYVVPRDDWIGLHFLYFALRVQDLPSVSADSAVPGLNRHLAYRNMQIVPPRQLVHRFEDCVWPTRALANSVASESESLSHLRDTLLPKLLSGELRVRGTVGAPAPA